jgi:hypothetical protein
MASVNPLVPKLLQAMQAVLQANNVTDQNDILATLIGVSLGYAVGGAFTREEFMALTKFGVERAYSEVFDD